MERNVSQLHLEEEWAGKGQQQQQHFVDWILVITFREKSKLVERERMEERGSLTALHRAVAAASLHQPANVISFWSCVQQLSLRLLLL